MKTKHLPFSLAVIAGLLACSILLRVSAAQADSPFVTPQDDEQKQEAAAKKEDQEKTPDKEKQGEEGKDEEDKREVLAIVGGDIVTVTRETIRGGTVLVEDGKITALGNRIEVPEEATRIDATGKTITPGFIAMNASRVGLSTPSDRNAKYADSLDPFDRNISLSLGVGITSACLQVRSGRSGRFGRAADEVFPYSERFVGLDPDEHELSSAQEQTERDYGEFVALCPCCGLPILPTEPIVPSRPSATTPQNNVLIKMSYGQLDGMLVAENACLDVTPGSLTGALNQRKWREQIDKAKQYLKDQEAHQKAVAAGKKEKPPRKPVSDEILRLVQKKIALRIPANSVSEMQSLVQLAQELDYRLILAGAGESWVIPSELAEAEVAVVITPRSRRSPTFGAEDRSGTWIETPRVLEDAGVPFALSTLSSSISLNGLAGRDLTSLSLEAAFAVRGGASERKALAALTIAPARMLGVDDRIGSIEVGKDADLLVLNGPPLDYRTYVETAIVNGRVAYQRKEARVLPVYRR